MNAPPMKPAPPAAGAVRAAGVRTRIAPSSMRPAAFRPVAANPVSTAALAVYVFLLGSLAAEFLRAYGHVHFPLIAACFAVIVSFYAVAGTPFRFFRTPFVIPWCALLFWWILAGATGFYKSRSIVYLLEYGIRIHTLPLIFCGIAVDTRGLRRLLYGCGFSVIALLMACVLWGRMWENRFIVPETSLGNANDLALRLLLFGAFALVFFGGGVAAKTLALFLLPVLNYYVLKTGSRANVVTLAVILVICLFLLPGKKKLIPIAAIGISFLALPFLPTQTLDRLQSFFSVPEGLGTARAAELAQTAVDSTNARMQLQRRALELTIEHPFLGVGPLNFEDAVEDMVRKEEGHRSGWQVAHNSYLQVSAESGLPGLLFYGLSIVMCLITSYRSYRRSRGEAAIIPFVILLSSVVYAVGILFCSVPYDFHLALLVGLASASHLVFQQPASSPLPR